jgi:hypothetical protein|eukprot:COSAG01_NODE_21657_length_891_cov_2.347222_1_plen_79_part_00
MLWVLLVFAIYAGVIVLGIQLARNKELWRAKHLAILWIDGIHRQFGVAKIVELNNVTELAGKFLKRARCLFTLGIPRC